MRRVRANACEPALPLVMPWKRAGKIFEPDKLPTAVRAFDLPTLDSQSARALASPLWVNLRHGLAARAASGPYLIADPS